MKDKLVLTSLIVAIFINISGICYAEEQIKSCLKVGTVIPLQLGQVISSGKNKLGDTVLLKVVSDIKDAQTDKVIIKQGTFATGQISELTKSKRIGKAGSISLIPVSTQAIDGSNVVLTASDMSREGKSAKGAAIGMGIVGGLVFFPLMFGLMKKGKEAIVPAGTPVNAFVGNDICI